MAEDIGIELHDKIKAAFDVRCGKDSTLSHIKRKIENGTATMEDTSIYARRMGELLRKSIESTTKPDDLPDGKMYYNIAQSILEPLLRGNYDDINAICAEVQSALDAKKGIGLKPQKADFPAERIRAAIGGAAVKETAEHAIQVLGRTAENITGSFQTDYIKKNAEFRGKAGLTCYIERKDGFRCCDWCAGLAGRYRYPDEVPKDVYRRHDNCTCDVSYVSEKGRQNVHSKRWANEQAKAQRIEYAASLPKPMKLTRAEAQAKESEILAQRRLTYDRKRGIITSGAISGALNPYSKEAERHAVQYYESVRHMKTDIKRISDATGISQDKIEKIKQHIFILEHDLLDGRHRFAPSYDMAQSWQRLINNSFEEKDIVLLKHEYAELRYMEKGLSQNDAHIKASKKYNYAKYCE
jgi:anti-sigma28 factor (negative regulator of flagellin synthesis)